MSDNLFRKYILERGKVNIDGLIPFEYKIPADSEV